MEILGYKGIKVKNSIANLKILTIIFDQLTQTSPT